MTMKLGQVQRDVMRSLRVDHPHTPLTLAAALGIAPSCDTGYYAATLVRLAERGIAEQVGDTWGYVRGPKWREAMGDHAAECERQADQQEE